MVAVSRNLGPLPWPLGGWEVVIRPPWLFTHLEATPNAVPLLSLGR